MARTFLIDERTVLRPLAEADAGPLYVVIDKNRAHLRRWLPWLDGTRSRDDIHAFRLRVAAQENEGVGMTRVIERDRALCGIIGFNHIDLLNKKAELGYWLDKQQEGQGLCYRGCQQLASHGFGEIGLNRIAIAAAVGNRRSRGVAERLGFSFEGVLRDSEWLYDHYVDHTVYSMLRREWERRGC
jgi:ribosomal-protein-serine acetyltransferase